MYCKSNANDVGNIHTHIYIHTYIYTYIMIKWNLKMTMPGICRYGAVTYVNECRAKTNTQILVHRKMETPRL